MYQKDYLTDIIGCVYNITGKTNDGFQHPMKEAEKECPLKVRTNLDSAMPWTL